MEFPNTRLSVIEIIRTGNDEDRKAALQSFIAGYRPALISFLVYCKGISQVDAEDCVQEFILNRILNGRILELANGQGRFRNLLRVSLQRFLIDTIRKKNREPIENELDVEQSYANSAEQPDQFDRIWATAVFRSALSTMKASSVYWNLFVDRVLTHPPLPYDQIVKRHQYESPEKASNYLITAKRHFNRILQQCIRDQSHWTENCSDEELQEEVEFLKTQLAQPLLLQNAIEGLTPDASQDFDLSTDHTITGDHLILMEESPDSQWQNEDLPLIFSHLINQNASDLDASITIDSSLSYLIFDRSRNDKAILDEIRQLKEFFNKRGKTKQSLLPEKIDVSMTFALIASFIVRGGLANDVTTTREDLLALRLEQLAQKEWIPAEMKSLFQNAIESLLA